MSFCSAWEREREREREIVCVCVYGRKKLSIKEVESEEVAEKKPILLRNNKSMLLLFLL